MSKDGRSSLVTPNNWLIKRPVENVLFGYLKFLWKLMWMTALCLTACVFFLQSTWSIPRCASSIHGSLFGNVASTWKTSDIKIWGVSTLLKGCLNLPRAKLQSNSPTGPISCVRFCCWASHINNNWSTNTIAGCFRWVCCSQNHQQYLNVNLFNSVWQLLPPQLP